MSSPFNHETSNLQTSTPVKPLEKPEGTMSTRSAFYIERPSDRIALETIQEEGVTITIKGPRQMGKSSLLLRVRESAQAAGKRTALFDFQLFDKATLTNPDLFFRQWCNWITDELEMDNRVDEYWLAPLGISQKTSRYLQRYLLKEINQPLSLIMDEVDRIFDTPFRSDFFGMLRSWHNNRQTSPLWQSLDLVLVTSTEPYQLIEDLNQSPFNVGEVIELVDFTIEQVAELNKRHGDPLTGIEVAKLMGLLSGHPFLVRKALYLVASGRLTSQTLFAEATSDRGPFGDHLRNQLFRLHERPELVEGMRQVIRNKSCHDERTYFRLRGAGLVKRENYMVVPRCRLYADYFNLVTLDTTEESLGPNAAPITAPVPPAVASGPNVPAPISASNSKGTASHLSERELEVLRLVASGLTNPQIAERLVISVHTVNSHLTTIYSKLDIGSRFEAVHYALRQKLV